MNWRWLFGDPAQLADWTPQRAHQAEIATLRAHGVVVEPHWLWSLPAQAREQAARVRREQSGRKRFRTDNVREMKVSNR